MLTKSQFCKMIIDDFKTTENISDDDNLENHLRKSSKLCVALEYLGMIKEQNNIKYASTRGGTLFMHYDLKNKDVGQLSARELLELLPE